MRKALVSNALMFLIVGLIGFGAVLGWGKTQFSALGPLAKAICFTVPSGSNFSDVSDDLLDAGAIETPWIFRIGVRNSGKSGDLKAGRFIIREGASMAEITDELTQSGAATCGSEIVLRVGVSKSDLQMREVDPTTERMAITKSFILGSGELPSDYNRLRQDSATEYRVTMAEGATVWLVAEALKQAEFLSGEVGVLPQEGMLAPDSYAVAAGSDRGALMAAMVAKQEEQLAAAWATRATDLPIDSPEDLLILASIIEKETGIAEERGLVAGVFVNRLRQGIRLQTDPSVIYGITLGKEILGRGLRVSELRADTPYNTYVINGLPVTAIANPGKDALEAAANPEATDFIFFVADGTGGHAFAATLSEHNANVAKWRAAGN
ncbi:MAG: endolytic transglycosylase MltG [Rhodobacteraceae bacterium]|nr:endolytic transglycosylase MltG [Paracoccaceae bacterium]